MAQNNCYINGIGAVTVQGVWDETSLDAALEVEVSLAMAQQPSYKELIPAAMLRRMSKGIKMGIHASQQALDAAGNPELDAIITGTGLGCLEDSEKFLKNVLDNEEEFLTPTSFIQSTHNTVGAQIALRLSCKAYNFTYVNGVTSFESALLDALLQLQTGEAQHILVGGVDEIYGRTFELKEMIAEVKSQHVKESMRDSSTPGVNFGESTTFFTLENSKKASTYAQVLDVDFLTQLEDQELQGYVERFLKRNGLTTSDISLIITGRNGDLLYDSFYDNLATIFPLATETIYKNIVGQNDVASAFGLATASFILKKQEIPATLLWGELKQSAFKNVLLYNQYLGRNHSLTLVQYVEA